MTVPVDTSTVADDLMLFVVGKLKDAEVISNVDRIRRDHRTLVPKEESPAVHVIDGDQSYAVAKNDCDRHAILEFKIVLIVRSDYGYETAKPIKIRVMAATKPDDVVYPHNAVLTHRRVRSTQEIADQDVMIVEMDFVFSVFVPGTWNL